MIPTDYKDINVNYVYLKNAMKIYLTLMKNYTYWVLLRVSHSVTLRFTLVAPLYSPKANYSLVTGLYNTYLVEFGYHLEWFRSGALLKAHTKGPFQTITHTKFRCHSLIVTIKGTGNHYRKWFWSDAPMGARIVGLVQTTSHPKPYPHPVFIDFIKGTCISTQYSRRHFPLSTCALTPGLQNRAVKTPNGYTYTLGPLQMADSLLYNVNQVFSALYIANYVLMGCVNTWKFFRRNCSEKPLKSADSAGSHPVKNPVKTLRAKKRNIPCSKLTKETSSRLEKTNMEKSKLEKRNRRLTRKAKRARVRFIVDDSSSTNSAEENQVRPAPSLDAGMMVNENLTAQTNSTKTTTGSMIGKLNDKPNSPPLTLPQKSVASLDRHYISSKRSLHCLHLDQRTPSKSPVKRSHMDRDTTYTVNQDTDRLAAPTQITQEELPTLSVTVNASDDQNNNDVIIGMEPTERSQRRNDAIDAMEQAGSRLSSTASPSASTSGVALPHSVSAYALLPTPLRDEIGIAGAHNLALAAIANALATEQLNRVQLDAAEPHSLTHHTESLTPDPMAEDSHDSQAVLVDGGLNATTLEDTVFEQDTVEVESDNDEVTPLYPLGLSSPSNPFRPFSPPGVNTSEVSPPWTPNLHPCQAPLFVPYNACQHDYTRSDERVCYGGSSSDCSPSPLCKPRSECSPGCFNPKRCLRHYPFTFGCNVCIESGWCPPHHPDLNLTPEFIRVASNYPNDIRPVYASCEAGRYVPITRMFSPFPASPQQVWVDATPSSTSSSDVERHEEIKRQTINPDTSTTSMDLSTMFQEEIDILVDNWSLEQIQKGNMDDEFLNADRNRRKEMMEMGKYDPSEDTDELRRLRHPSEADSDIGVWKLVMPKRFTRSKRSKSRRRTAVPPIHVGGVPPTRVTPVAVTKAAHNPMTARETNQSLHASFKENAVNTPNGDGNVLTQKIVTPYQETVETPPVIYSVVDNGKDYTEILKDLVSKGIKYARMEAVLTGSSDVSMEQKLRDVESDYDGVVKRQDYLENMHHLFLSGIAARDASVTDYTTADDTTAPAPPSPHTHTSPAVAPIVVFPPVKSAEDAAMSVAALRKEANRLILEADRLTEANEAAAETTTLLIREAEKIIDAMESRLEEEPLMRISQGLKQAEALLLQKTPIQETTANKPKLTMINTPVPGSSAEGSPMNATGTAYPEVVDHGVAVPSVPSAPNVTVDGVPEVYDDGRVESANLSEFFTPLEEPSKLSKQTNKDQLLEYKAPTPNLGGESAEKKFDADYIPSYSNLATSESDISVVAVMSEETRSKLRSRSLAGQSVDTVQRYSEDIIRKPSQRRASVHAKAHIRDQLISEKDKKDASYNGGETRKDTPQVSPSIPLNPGTPMSNGGWQRPFIPSNNLVLTRPVFHFNGDDELDDMVKKFNSSAATSTASIIRAPLQELQQGFRPTRRSFLRPTSRPVPSSQSTYPPPHGLKTWRKYPGSPTKLVQNIGVPSENGCTTGNDNLNDRAVSDGSEQSVIEVSPSTSLQSSPSPSAAEN